MSPTPPPSRRGLLRRWITPFTVLGAGSVAVVLALILAPLATEAMTPVRVGLIVFTLLMGVAGANLRIRQADLDVEQRAISAGYLAYASFLGLLAFLACAPAWDSFRLLIGVLIAVGIAGALLILLPEMIRRVAIVLLVAVHFCGILTAVFSVPPPNAPVCWLTYTSWTVFYRPYLQFMYLNNAYHFYSPEPGPPTLLWFRIEYDHVDEDGKRPFRWVKIPNREDYPTRLQYQRRLALTESTNMPMPSPAWPEFQHKLGRRQEVAARPTEDAIPFHPDFLPFHQYRAPTYYSRIMIETYSQHIATDPAYQHEKGYPIASVKVYRVVHSIILAKDLAKGLSPIDETLYLPYFMGEFHWAAKNDVPGGEESTSEARVWQMKDPDDPMLYWLVPIVKEKSRRPGFPFTGGESELVLRNYLLVHSGDKSSP